MSPGGVLLAAVSGEAALAVSQVPRLDDDIVLGRSMRVNSAKCAHS